MVEYFYHLKPNKMMGKNLLPLSSLEEEFPSIAKGYIKSYKGRERILNKKIPPLDCRWKDVIFGSCLDPRLIFAALELLGLFDDEPITILKFPISVLNKKEFCKYQESKSGESFSKLTTASYKEERTISIDTMKYFVDSVKKKESPLIFYGVAHILIKGDLDLDKAEEIKYKSILK